MRIWLIIAFYTIFVFGSTGTLFAQDSMGSSPANQQTANTSAKGQQKGTKCGDVDCKACLEECVPFKGKPTCLPSGNSFCKNDTERAGACVRYSVDCNCNRECSPCKEVCSDGVCKEQKGRKFCKESGVCADEAASCPEDCKPSCQPGLYCIDGKCEKDFGLKKCLDEDPLFVPLSSECHSKCAYKCDPCLDLCQKDGDGFKCQENFLNTRCPDGSCANSANFCPKIKLCNCYCTADDPDYPEYKGKVIDTADFLYHDKLVGSIGVQISSQTSCKLAEEFLNKPPKGGATSPYYSCRGRMVSVGEDGKPAVSGIVKGSYVCKWEDPPPAKEEPVKPQIK